MFDDMPKAYTTYMNDLSNICKNILGQKLIGIYLQGSFAQDDHRPDTSDIDILAVVSESLSATEKEHLAHALNHKQLPVPGAGLEIIFITNEMAGNPTTPPIFELAMSTGENWQTEMEENVEYPDLLIGMGVCYQKGMPLLGPDPKDIFKAPDVTNVLKAMIHGLEWHHEKILDDFHDPLGQYSVLNACRTWHYATTHKFTSKSGGGLWVLEMEPENKLVKDALSIRNKELATPLAYEEIDAFLRKVIDICQKKVKD